MKLVVTIILFSSSFLSFNGLFESYRKGITNHCSSIKFKNSQDTVKVKNIDQLKDSLTKAVDQFDKITINQTTGDCFGDELLYYNRNYSLVMSEGQFGCSTEETKYLIIQSEGEYIYSQYREIGDGILMKKIDIYYIKGKPFYGKLTKYNIDWEKYIVTDSLISIPKENELIDLAKSAIDITSYHDGLLFKIKKIEAPKYEKGRVRLYFPDQQLDEDKYYLIDSVFYQNIKTDY